MLASWFHTLSPFAIRLSPDFGIRWYGLAYLAGFLCAYLVLRALGRRGLSLIPPERVGDALLWLVGGTIVGGRLGYIIFYDPALLITSLDHFPWWGALAINEGGMASHGAMVGLTLAGLRVSRGFKDPSGKRVGQAPFLHILDLICLVSPPGLFLGRVANFVNGELLGAFAAPPGQDGPWYSVKYPQELDFAVPDPATRALSPGPHLQQTPEQWDAILSLARAAASDGNPRLGLRTLAHEGWRFQNQLRPLISPRYPSQLLQAVAEGLIVGAILWILWARPRTPGVILALFLICYGILRILTELVRLPDAHLQQERFLMLSRGQWLSVLMILVGAALLASIAKTPRAKLGGWLSSRPATPPAPQ